jgi:amino acid adenylation domain-containing protein
MLTSNQRAALSARLRQGRDRQSEAIPPRPAGLRDLPLSFAQEQLWFLDKLAPGRPTYNVPQALRLSGPLGLAALKAALEALFARHEALRTRLITSDAGDPIQIIDPPAPLSLELAGLPAQPLAKVRQLAQAEAVRPFTLSGGSLARARLFKLADDDHVLLVVVHHVIFDGWSARILLHDLAALYHQQITGEPSALTTLPIQFADYALWERTRLANGNPAETSAAQSGATQSGPADPAPAGPAQAGPAQAELKQYWRNTLANAPVVRFPADRPRPISGDGGSDSGDNGAGALAEHLIDGNLLTQLRNLSHRTGTTLFVILLSALQALLHRYTGQTDLIVGTMTANRRRPELASLIGFLVNTLPIRTDISGDPSFTELIERVRQATIAAYAHQDLPFAKIVAASGVPRYPGRDPLFQIALTYADRDETPVPAGGTQFALSDLIVGITAAKFDLDFSIESRTNGLWIECSYKTALFSEERIARLLSHLEALLRGAAHDPATRLSELPLLTNAERHREQDDWNPAASPIPPGCVHEAFERQAAETPEATAVEFGAERISYAELNRQADRIARQLRSAGVGPEVLVAVGLEPGPRRLAALIGIWKAGGGYLPLDPAMPRDRLAFMIADASAAVIVTDQPTAASLPATTATVLNLDAVQLGSQDQLTPANASPANVAYVIYTSGSTGQPKGVVVEHRQAISFLTGAIDLFQVGPRDSVLQFSSLSFDASVQEMFMPLLAGGRIMLAAPDILHSPRRLAALLTERAITIAVLTPSVISLLGDQELPDLRALICGGEELHAELATRWLRPGLRLVNDYGPTETTVSATCHDLTAATPLPPPIGLPLPRGRAYVLDQHLNQVPVGVTAELHLGGAGVARGYLNRPALTAQRFIPDPFCPGARLYRTGDLCYRRPDGTIVFAGRADQQIKLRGLRIELGEIEAAIAAYAQVSRTIVTIFNPRPGEKSLVAYLCPRAGDHVDLADLRRHLSAILPSYMVPEHLIILAELPLTVGGKVDRQALPPPTKPAPPQPEQPATQAEAVLVELFAAVLSHPHLNPTDNFFTSGGNSLQAMRLADLITTRTGHDLTPAAIFLHPTPRDLANHLATDASSRPATDASGRPVTGANGYLATGASGRPSPANLVPLTTDGSRAPLILIHAIAGTVYDYADLASGLARTFSCYGLQAPGLTQPPPSQAASVADVAARYIELLRAELPDGPYCLGGWSMGGVLAYEMARQLEAQAEHVPLLVLIDPPYVVPPSTDLSGTRLTAQFVADAVASLRYSTGSRPAPETTSTSDQLSWLANLVDASDSQLNAQLARRLEVFAAHNQLLAGYQPEPGTIRAPTVFVSASRSLNAPSVPDWQRHLTGPVYQVVLDSDHYELLRLPLSAKVAAAVKGASDDQ